MTSLEDFLHKLQLGRRLKALMKLKHGDWLLKSVETFDVQQLFGGFLWINLVSRKGYTNCERPKLGLKFMFPQF